MAFGVMHDAKLFTAGRGHVCLSPCSAWRPHGLAFKTIPPQPLPRTGLSFLVNSNK